MTVTRIDEDDVAIKYVSKHHTDDDPGGVIHEVIQAGPEFQGPAEDIILSWTLKLASDRDPAAAAQRLLQKYDLAEGPLPEGAVGRVVEMLREAALYPETRLRRHLGRQRRSDRHRRRRER